MQCLQAGNARKNLQGLKNDNHVPQEFVITLLFEIL